MTREMKDSGIEWIGEIPAHWELKRIKNIIIQTKDGIKIGPFGSALTNKTKDKSEYNVYSQANLIASDFSKTKNTIDGETFANLQAYEVYPDDICLSMMGTIGKCKKVPKGIKRGIMDSHLIKVRLSESIDSRYFEYVYDKDLGGVCFQQMQLDKKGFIMDGLNTFIVKNLYFPVPPIEEQVIISDYLDSECSRIDAVIEQTHASIEKYKELKQAVITQAVTKGIHPGRQMIDSGIEWIGKIPAEWHLQKLKNVTSLITDGTHITPNYIEFGIPFISIKDISSGVIDFSNVKYISDDEHQILSKSTPIEKGDMLFTRIGTLGVFLLVDTDTVFDIFVSVGLIKFKTSVSEVFKQFIRYFLLSDCTMNYINLVKAGGGTAAAKFNLTDVRNTIFVVPSQKEQQEIVTMLDNTCAKLDTLIIEKQQLLAELETYKKSLIYEYVTGKKEVPACQ